MLRHTFGFRRRGHVIRAEEDGQYLVPFRGNQHVDAFKGDDNLLRELVRMPDVHHQLKRTVGHAQVGKIPPELRRTFDTFSDFYIGDVGVVPFSIPHDAADPVGYRLWGGGLSIATATDLGHFPRSVRDAVAGSSLVLLESNHDPDMLRHNDHYNERLKQRILGNRGHLSNAACADALLQIVESGTKNVILGHLSGENNTPSLAYHISEDRMTREGIRLGQDLTLDVALRDRVGNIYTLGDGK